MATSAATAQRAPTATGRAQIHKGLEISVTSVERASSAPLSDCPPGANTQRAMARAGEEFVIVTIALKGLPDYKPSPIKRPVLVDRAKKTYNTAASFVDAANATESSCAFPYRVPVGTRLESLRIDALVFDLTSLDAK